MPDHHLILVIEDGEYLGEAIVDQLVADEYTAKLARSANHATALARHEAPALVILGDIDLLPHSALKLLRSIRCGDQAPPGSPTCRSS